MHKSHIEGQRTELKKRKTKVSGYPDWVILHIPHDSTYIPPDIRSQFVLPDPEMELELICMTDKGTKDLFTKECPNVHMVYASVSRLVVDVEHFQMDEKEPMPNKDMGIIRTHSANNGQLRRALSIEDKQKLLDLYYFPHFKALTKEIGRVLDEHGRCLVVDCHSFPSSPLPYEIHQIADGSDICLGADEFHTPGKIVDSFAQSFSDSGFSVSRHHPFSSGPIPLRYYHKDNRVCSITIEVNRKLYMDETTGELCSGFAETASKITATCQKAISLLG
jgi:N-formylglutamate amidohydrolase